MLICYLTCVVCIALHVVIITHAVTILVKSFQYVVPLSATAVRCSTGDWSRDTVGKCYKERRGSGECSAFRGQGSHCTYGPVEKSHGCVLPIVTLALSNNSNFV